MAIEFDCPACDATIRVKDDAAGKKGRCPKCKVLLLVPEPEPDDDIEAEPLQAPPPEPGAVIPAAVAVPSAEAMEAPRPARDSESAPVFTDEEPQAFPGPVPEPALASEIAVEVPVEEELVVVAAPASTPTPFPPPPDIIGTRGARAGGAKRTSRRSSSGRGTIVMAVVAFVVLAIGSYSLYRMTLPAVPDEITGSRYAAVGLPPARFSAPLGENVSDEVRATVMRSLVTEGLPLKSGFVEVWLEAEGEELLVSVEPGPRSSAVRVPLGELASIRSLLTHERDHIAGVKMRELNRSSADFFRDYAAYLENGTSITRLPEYRDAVALNAATGVTGYAVEAIVGSTPFRCVYEDNGGGCYFFPPKEAKQFHIRGRKLADGGTPLPIEIDVIIKDADGEPPGLAGEETTESNVKDDADESSSEKDATSAGDPMNKPAMPDEKAKSKS